MCESEPGSISADRYNAAQAYIAAGNRYSLICCEYWIARFGNDGADVPRN